MTNKVFMLLAIKAAKQSTQPTACGCVIIQYDYLFVNALPNDKM